MIDRISIPGFTGTTTEEIIRSACDAYGADYGRLGEVLKHPRFEELAAVLVPIDAHGGVSLLDDSDADEAILSDYYAAIFESIERAFNVGTTQRDEIDVSPEIFAAMSIMRLSHLLPNKTFESLPPIDAIDGRTQSKRHFNAIMNRYDKNHELHRFE